MDAVVLIVWYWAVCAGKLVLDLLLVVMLWFCCFHFVFFVGFGVDSFVELCVLGYGTVI